MAKGPGLSSRPQPDVPVSRGATSSTTSDGVQKLRIPIVGMDCARCADAIEHQVRGLAGVRRANVNPSTETLFVEFEPGRVSVGEIVRA